MLADNSDQDLLISQIAQIASDPGGPSAAFVAALGGSYGYGFDFQPTPGAFPGVPFRFEETNSLANGGEAGVSDTFGAALWSLKYCLKLAAAGADGLNFHLGDTANYDAYHLDIYDKGDGTKATGALYAVCPPFYGHLAFTRMLPGKLQPTQSNGPATLFTWAVAKDDGTFAVALINTDRSNAVSTTITLPRAVASASSLLLSAPSLEAKDGITLGGAPVGIDGSWNPMPTPTPVSGASMTVTVAPASGQIITAG